MIVIAGKTVKRKTVKKSPLKKQKSKNFIKKSDKTTAIILALIIVVCFLAAVKAMSSIVTKAYDDKVIVCIDPGHGGNDNGANLGDRYEKDDNLRLSLKVKAHLEAMGAKVIMTRDDDTYISLNERCRIANDKKCDVFVAIHRNSSQSGQGIECWIAGNASSKEKKLAENLLSALDEVGTSLDRGVKSGYRTSKDKDYYVNSNTNMTSCLLEVGFITDKEDNKLFDKNIDAYAEKLANAIYNSVDKK